MCKIIYCSNGVRYFMNKLRHFTNEIRCFTIENKSCTRVGDIGITVDISALISGKISHKIR